MRGVHQRGRGAVVNGNGHPDARPVRTPDARDIGAGDHIAAAERAVRQGAGLDAAAQNCAGAAPVQRHGQRARHTRTAAHGHAKGQGGGMALAFGQNIGRAGHTQPSRCAGAEARHIHHRRGMGAPHQQHDPCADRRAT